MPFRVHDLYKLPIISICISFSPCNNIQSHPSSIEIIFLKWLANELLGEKSYSKSTKCDWKKERKKIRCNKLLYGRRFFGFSFFLVFRKFDVYYITFGECNKKKRILTIPYVTGDFYIFFFNSFLFVFIVCNFRKPNGLNGIIFHFSYS